MKTSTSPILCYIGLTIVHQEVLRRVNFYRGKITGEAVPALEEVHITLVPPFYTDYETASAINFGCMASTLQSVSIVNTTKFLLQSLSHMNFEGERIVHFPVQVYTREKGILFQDFGDRVNTLRKQIQKLGSEIRLPVPDTYTPHISVSTQVSIHNLEEILQESKNDGAIYFKASYPTLYVKYKGVGYRDLTTCPAKI
jgi:2'-5' RNA ligase